MSEKLHFPKKVRREKKFSEPSGKILIQEPGKHIPSGRVYIKCSKNILLILWGIYFHAMVGCSHDYGWVVSSKVRSSN